MIGSASTKPGDLATLWPLRVSTLTARRLMLWVPIARLHSRAPTRTGDVRCEKLFSRTEIPCLKGHRSLLATSFYASIHVSL